MQRMKLKVALMMSLLIVCSLFFAEEPQKTEIPIKVVPIEDSTLGKGFFISREALEEIAVTLESADLYEQETKNLLHDITALTEERDYWKKKYERAKTFSVIGFTVDGIIDAILTGGMIYITVSK